MSQTQIQGMKLCAAEDPQGKNKNWILQTAEAFFACTALLFLLADITGMSSTEAVLLITGGGLCILYGSMIRFGRKQWFYPGLLMILLFFVFAGREKLLEGFRICWNQASDTLTSQTGWVLPEWERQLAKTQETASLMIFTVFLAACIACLVCFLTAWIPQVLAAVIVAMLFVGFVLFHYEASSWCLLFVLSVVVFLLLCSGWTGKHGLHPVLSGVGFTGILICVMMIIISIPGVKDWAKETSLQAKGAAHTYLYETENTTLPEGNFLSYQEPDGENLPALTVTMSKPEAMYLRGFTGCTFENDVWKPQDTKSLSENKEFLYWMNLNEFQPQTQFYEAAQEKLEQTTVSVQNVGACSQYRYIPFTLCDGTYMQPENLNADGMKEQKGRTYEYTVASEGASNIPDVIENLQKSEKETVQKFRQTESTYRTMIYDTYLQVPEEAEKLLGKQWKKIATEYGAVDNLTLQQRQTCAIQFLSQCFTKDGIANDATLPLDVVRGSSYQYATVATLTLRYYGIPARYAEGYVISDEMAKGATEGEALDVNSSCAQAWVEVYQDGIGWIPLDVVPGMGNVLEQMSDSGSSGKSASDTKTSQKQEKKAQLSELLDETAGTILKKSFHLFFWILVLLLFVFLVLAFRRKIRLKQRQKKYEAENKNEAVSWIFADSIQLLEQLGLSRENGSVRKLHDPIKQRFGEAYVKEFDEMLKLNDSAMFCSKPLTKQQWERAMAYKETTLTRVCAETKWWKRFFMKWIQCMF